MSSSASSLQEEIAAMKKVIAQSEQEISQIKTKINALKAEQNGAEETPNSLIVAWTKVSTVLSDPLLVASSYCFAGCPSNKD
jgi:phage shock protein A